MTCGIYKLTAPSGKCYIGSSKNCEERANCHRRQARKNSHSVVMNSAYAKYGDLSLTILEACSEADLLKREQHYIDTLRPEYNCSQIAGKVDWTPALRAKLSASLSAYQASDRKPPGRPCPDEAKAKISAANRGRKLSPETRALMSSQRRGRRMPSGFGERVSQRARLENLSHETRARLSASKLGNQHSVGIKRNPETLAKMSAAQQRRRAAERHQKEQPLG